MNKMIDKMVDAWESYETGLAILLCIGIIIGSLAWVFGVMCFQSWLVMLLWNWVAVELFGAPVLTFWVAFGLRWLCALLFQTRVNVKKEK
jgi:hypothetical protein